MAETRLTSERADAQSGHRNVPTEKPGPKKKKKKTPSKASYLSEMSAPVYGRPAVEAVLHREVSRVWGALKKGAQGTDVSIPACPMEREAAG